IFHTERQAVGTRQRAACRSTSALKAPPVLQQTTRSTRSESHRPVSGTLVTPTKAISRDSSRPSCSATVLLHPHIETPASTRLHRGPEVPPALPVLSEKPARTEAHSSWARPPAGPQWPPGANDTSIQKAKIADSRDDHDAANQFPPRLVQRQ